MRFSWATSIALVLVTSTVLADPIVIRRRKVAAVEPSSTAVHHEISRLGYPLRLRKIDNEIKLLDTRVGMLKERIKDYEHFPTSAFLVTLQNAKLELLELEQKADLLRHERLLLRIYVKDQIRRR